MSTVWHEIAQELRGQHEEAAVRLERYRVTRETPLLLDRVDGNQVLEEGDQDVELTDGFRQYRDSYGLPVGSIVRVIRERDHWVLLGAQTTRTLPRLGA